MNPASASFMLPKDHTTQLPTLHENSSFTNGIIAIAYWNGFDLAVLSAKSSETKRSKNEKIAIREGAIIVLAGLILASPYFMRSSQVFSLLKRTSSRIITVLATASLILVRESLFRSAEQRLVAGGESVQIDQSLNKSFTSPERAFIRFQAARQSIRKYASTLTEEEKANPKVLAYVSYILFIKESLREEDLNELTTSGFDMSYFLQAIPFLFSEAYRNEMIGKSEASSSIIPPNNSKKLCTLCVTILQAQTIPFNKEGFTFSTDELQRKNLTSTSCHNTEYLLEALHRELRKNALSMKELNGNLSQGISRRFYDSMVNGMKLRQEMCSYDELLERVIT